MTTFKHNIFIQKYKRGRKTRFAVYCGKSCGLILDDFRKWKDAEDIREIHQQHGVCHGNVNRNL